jgi:TP901 family phage tail tape measure protein
MTDKTLAIKLAVGGGDSAAAEFKKVGDGAKTMGDTIETASKKSATGLKDLKSELTTVGSALSVAGAVGTGFFGLATASSMDFTAAMSNVNSIAHVSATELSSLRETVLALSDTYGQGATDLADGLYNIIGSGFEANDAVKILTASVVAAGAGLTTTETAATAVTAVLNAYSMSADQAGNVSDILFKIVDSGVISFETLADSMGRTLPLASSLGVSLEELGAAYAALTRVGYSGDMAETGIAALMTAAIGPTDALKESVKAYGYETTEALIAAEGFTGFLKFLQDTAGGSSEKMLALTGNTRANGAALALAAQGGYVYADMLDQMSSAASDGAYTLSVFGLQMDNAAGSVQIAREQFNNFKIEAGSALEPLVAFAADTASTVLGAFGALPESIRDAVTWMGAAGSAATLMAGGFLLLVPRIVETRAALQTLAGASGVVGTIGRMIPALFGPAGLAVAGVVAVASAGIAVWNNHRDSVRATAEAYAALDAEVTAIDDRISSMKLTDDVATAFKLEALVGDTRAAGDKWASDLDKMETDWAAFWDTLGSDRQNTDVLSGPLFDNVLQKMVTDGQITQNEMEGILAGNLDLITQYSTAIAIAMSDYIASYRPTATDMALIESDMGELMDLISNPYVDAMKVIDDYAAARKQYLEGDHPDYQGFDAWWQQYKSDTVEATALTTQFNAAVAQTSDLLVNTAMAEIDAAKERKKAYEEYIGMVREHLTDLLEFGGLSDPLSMWNMSGHATEASLLADHINDLGAAMDSNYQLIVGNTDAIGKNMQTLDDWATGLIGVRGEYAEIDKLYAEGRISLEKYNEAQSAQETIMGANATVQRDVLAIQAALSPVIAQNAQDYADYIEQLRQLNDGIDDSADGAQQQMAALAWLDSGTAGRVQQFMELGQSMQDLDENGKAAFETMVDGLAATDPMFIALLENAGLVRQELDGSFSVNWEGLNGADSDIDRLTESIDALIVTLGGVPPHVETEISVVDNATGPATSIRDLLASLPDHKTTTITTVLETYYAPGGAARPMANALGGTIPAYAAGGVLFRAGELRPEVAHFADGGMALLPYDGYYTAPAGTYISPNYAGNTNTYGGVSIDLSGSVFHNTSRDDMNAWAANDLLPAIRDELQRVRVGQGMA